MEVVGFFPSKGKIEFIIVKDNNNQYQTISKNLNWYISDRWGAKAILEFAISKGFLELPKPIDFDFFIQHISQFEK